MKRLLILTLLLPIPALAIDCTPSRTAAGTIQRSPAKVRQFQKINPCPATGQTTGRCPGYVVDHIIPLCACGLDHPSNMQWQTKADAKEKDRAERNQCRGTP